MKTMELVSTTDVRELLQYFSKCSYKVKDCDSKVAEIQRKCEELFSKDYRISLIDNSNGDLAGSYPTQLIIPQLIRSSCTTESVDQRDRSQSLSEEAADATNLSVTMMKAKSARCWTRFPVPVILFEGKYICRSATLSGGVEIIGRGVYNFFTGSSGNMIDNNEGGLNESLSLSPCKVQSTIQLSPSEWQMFFKVRNQDIKLLKLLHVGYICDLMVEKKKVKFGMYITSSEKVDKENRYNEFKILSLPYPGCEFFHEYRKNNYSFKGLKFDWTQDFVNAQLVVPDDDISSQLNIQWHKYTDWEVVTMTQNYLKLLLKYINDGTSGMLVHCISGWDRTPLFISLLRLSLWADNKIHTSLSASEITFLTVAYDWFLFGHNLPDRLSKGEEILYFCFEMLKFLTLDEFSVNHISQKDKLHKDSDGNVSELECILLEESGARGSNTSLNSCSSSISNRSQDNPPAYFSTHCPDSGDETPTAVHTNGNIPPNIQGFHPCHQCHRLIYTQAVLEDNEGRQCASLTKNKDFSQICNLNESDNYYLHACPSSGVSTSPVAVPNISVRQRSESTSSTGCGSWQYITGTGSVRGSVSTRSSISSPTCELNQNANKQNIHHDLQDIQEKLTHADLTSSAPKTREERLSAVRSLFYNCYSATVGFNFKK